MRYIKFLFLLFLFASYHNWAEEVDRNSQVEVEPQVLLYGKYYEQVTRAVTVFQEKANLPLDQYRLITIPWLNNEKFIVLFVHIEVTNDRLIGNSLTPTFEVELNRELKVIRYGFSQ